MTPTPFCCDINSGSDEERNEFKELFDLATNKNWQYGAVYYGIDNDGDFSCEDTIQYALKYNDRIIPLSEGIAILKEMVGESVKQPTDLKVVRDRIVDAIDKSCSYEGGQIYDIDMNQLKERIDGILDSLQPKP